MSALCIRPPYKSSQPYKEQSAHVTDLFKGDVQLWRFKQRVCDPQRLLCRRFIKYHESLIHKLWRLDWCDSASTSEREFGCCLSFSQFPFKVPFCMTELHTNGLLWLLSIVSIKLLEICTFPMNFYHFLHTHFMFESFHSFIHSFKGSTRDKSPVKTSLSLIIRINFILMSIVLLKCFAPKILQVLHIKRHKRHKIGEYKFEYSSNKIGTSWAECHK